VGLRTDIKTLLDCGSPHFVLTRRGVPEVVVHGAAYFKVEGGSLQGSDGQMVMTARSLLKPWQYLAADLTGEEPFWALGLASHSGQPHHMEQLARLSSLAGAGEAELFCPREYPLDQGVASLMRNEGRTPTRLTHPCSGKHLVALAACKHHGYATDSYWDVDHPLQKKLAAALGKEINEKPIWLTDSCGLPTVAMTARAHINMWERLARSDEPRVRQLKELWLRNIRLVGGYGRLESDLMEVAPGRLIAKEGADGLLIIIALPSAAAPSAEPVATCLIKLASGYNSNYLALALWSILSRAAGLPPVFETVREFLRSRLEKWVPRDQELALPPFE
jgi:L-asparaginase II